MSESAPQATRGLLAELEAAHEAYEQASEQVTEHGENTLEAVAEAHERATTLLDKYESRATGTGDFQAFIEFQEAFATLVEGLGDDLPRREVFEKANEHFEKRRLSATDFDAAREALSPAAALADVLTERAGRRKEYRDAHRRVVSRRDELDGRIEELQRLRSLGDVDFDAPVEDLYDPIEAYNEQVENAFRTFRREASVREVLELVAETERYPLVSFRPPPADLREYAARAEVGTESPSKLLEYADYSPSKLAHYVENPQELKRNVAVHRSYLDGLNATPLKIAWPPPPADELWWRARELISVVGRFAPAETVEKLREVRALAHWERYEHLRRVAVARAELTVGERERLAEGTVEDDLERAQSEHDRLDRALSAHPGP